MPHDVFISNSTAEKLTAYAICSELESIGIRCWILPRDLDIGSGWDQSIANAVACCRIMIVVLFDYANRSDRVDRQLELAFNKGMVVIPFRTESPSAVGEPQSTAVDSVHWLEAMTPEMLQRVRSLRDMVRGFIDGQKDDPLQANQRIPRLSLESSVELPQREAINVTAPLPATDVLEGSPVSNTEVNSLPDFKDLEKSQSESEGAASQQTTTSKWMAIKAFLLTLLPFAIVGGVGVWQAKNWHRSQTREQATTAASIDSPVLAKVQHEERFSAADPGWGTFDANWTVADGKLRVTPLLNSSAVLINHGHGFTEAEITAEIMMFKGEDLGQLGGLVFWARDYNDCYAFVISADGKFALGRKLIGRWIKPIAKTGNPAIKTGIGQTNKLRVRTEGNQLTASINDIQVATLKGEAPQGVSYIGLYGESAETTRNVWEFTNLTVISTH